MDFSQYCVACFLALHSYYLALLTAPLIHKLFMKCSCISCFFKSTPTNPKASSVTWYLVVLHHCWITGWMTIFLSGSLPSPHSDPCIVPKWLCVPSHMEREFSCARDFTVLVFNVPQESVSWTRWTSFQSVVIAPCLPHKYRLADWSYLWLRSQSGDLLFNLLFVMWIVSEWKVCTSQVTF